MHSDRPFTEKFAANAATFRATDERGRCFLKIAQDAGSPAALSKYFHFSVSCCLCASAALVFRVRLLSKTIEWDYFRNAQDCFSRRISSRLRSRDFLSRVLWVRTLSGAPRIIPRILLNASKFEAQTLALKRCLQRKTTNVCDSQVAIMAMRLSTHVIYSPVAVLEELFNGQRSWTSLNLTEHSQRFDYRVSVFWESK